MKDRVHFIVYLYLFFFLIFLFVGTGKCHAGSNPPSLKYLGNAFVKIKTSDGKVLFIDPYGVSDPEPADLVLITHEHSDHNDLTRIIQMPGCRVIRAADAIRDSVYQTFVIGAITITAVPAYNQYHPKYSGVGYVVEFDGIKIYHTGGTGKIAEMASLAGRNITYALLPMSPGPEEMTQAAALIQAIHDIPIHTIMTPGVPFDLAAVALFTSPHKFILLPNQTLDLLTTTAVTGSKTVPMEFQLSQNYPNPFNPTTNIELRIAKFGFVSLAVFDALGRRVAQLVNEELPAGVFTVRWDAASFPSGVYFFRLSAAAIVETKRMILLR